MQLVQGPSTEGADNGRNSPSRRPATSRPPGKATKRLFPPANPDTKPGGEAGGGSPSSADKKKAAKFRPLLPPKTMKGALC